MTAGVIRVVIADDHPVFRDGLADRAAAVAAARDAGLGWI